MPNSAQFTPVPDADSAGTTSGAPLPPLMADVAICGGGCGGFAAAIQAARMGARVLVVEETPWLGGMLTSAGVVAFDGNQGTLTSGFYREVVREIELHYGGSAKTGPGWVTLTAFEPRVLARIFDHMALREHNIFVMREARATGLLREGDRVTGFTIIDGAGVAREVRAKITIEATEYGDLLELGGVEHRFGRESHAQTGEPDAPEHADLEIQDITYVAILKDYLKAAGHPAPPAPKSANYDPALFSGSTALDHDPADEHDHALHTWETFIDYGKLPNGKVMINWPFHANDFPDAPACFDRDRRAEAYERARAHTLDFVHYMQTTLGHPEWGVADDEYPTPDGLPFMPYVRETRRIVADRIMREQDVLPAEGNGTRPPWQPASIACGDYFLDHHHARAHPGPNQVFTEKYPRIGKFQVPAGVLFPKGLSGMMAAEKSIGVTHIVNGCTRLQPIVLLMGQAAGIIAALAWKTGVEPRDVPIRDVQEALLLRGAMLAPYDDVCVDDRDFLECQKLALAGVTLDDETYLYGGNATLTWDVAAELLVKAVGGDLPPVPERRAAYRTSLRQWTHDLPGLDLDFGDAAAFDRKVTRAQLAPVLCHSLGIDPADEVRIRFLDMEHTHPAARWIEPLYRRDLYDGLWHVNFKPDAAVPRKELALMIDRAFDPFRRLPAAG